MAIIFLESNGFKFPRKCGELIVCIAFETCSNQASPATGCMPGDDRGLGLGFGSGI